MRPLNKNKPQYNLGVTLYIDGGCSGNGQRDLSKRRMISVVTDEAGVVLSETLTAGGSNNVAELIAVRDAIRWCGMKGIRRAHVMTDSRNNLSWAFSASTKVGKAINDRETVLSLKAEITAAFVTGFDLTLTWVPREDNLAGHYIERVHAL
jgi:ribonuclease HI